MTELLQTAQKNLTFLAVCLAIAAVLVLLARLFERILPAEGRSLSPARRVSFVALFSALAGVFVPDAAAEDLLPGSGTCALVATERVGSFRDFFSETAPDTKI